MNHRSLALGVFACAVAGAYGYGIGSAVEEVRAVDRIEVRPAEPPAPRASDFGCLRVPELDAHGIEVWLCGRFGRG